MAPPSAHRLTQAAHRIPREQLRLLLEALADLGRTPLGDALAVNAMPVEHADDGIVVRPIEGPAHEPTVLVDLRLGGYAVRATGGSDAVASHRADDGGIELRVDRLQGVYLRRHVHLRVSPRLGQSLWVLAVGSFRWGQRVVEGRRSVLPRQRGAAAPHPSRGAGGGTAWAARSSLTLQDQVESRRVGHVCSKTTFSPFVLLRFGYFNTNRTYRMFQGLSVDGAGRCLTLPSESAATKEFLNPNVLFPS